MRNMSFGLFLLGTAFLSGSNIQTISKSNGVLKSEDLSYFKEEFNLYSFIETGTYAGDTTAVASEVFPQVYSIDIYEPLYTKARSRFAQSSNVHLYLGDTCDKLKLMIEDSPTGRLYWLDAHSSGGGTGGTPGFSPILQELNQIFAYEDADCVILIDDLRGMCHCDERTNLPLREIIQKVKEINSDLQFYSIGDVGIIFNVKKYPSIIVSDLVQSASFSRFFDPNCEDEEMLNRLIDAESFLSDMGNEDQESENFRKLVKFVNRNELGGEVIYLLWESLYKIGEMDYKSAIEDLQLVSNSFYSHWRIDAYLVKSLILNGQLKEACVLFDSKLLDIYKKHPKIIKKILGNTYEILMNTPTV
ncbi:MAG: hypothetical protein JSS09_08985 [Verrucomicrobia bacterium]|nr:hypothetical protein [Verrucomicrobiota bacterium]